MCNPMIAIAATSAAVSGAGAIAGYLGQNKAASANERAANFNYAQRLNTLGQQGEQVSAQASEQSFEVTLQRLQQAGRISASASDLGAGANVAEQITRGAFGDIGRTDAINQLNTQSQFNQLGNEAMGASIARSSQIAAVQRESPLTLALGLGKAVIQGASTFASLGGDISGGGGGSSGSAPVGE